jgi:hypothetical protein
VLKEYILRGMAERVLILTPASLVGPEPTFVSPSAK